jgi:hypothetical protein
VIFHKEDWALIPFSLLWGGFAIFWLLETSGIGDFWTNRPDKTFQWFGVIWRTPFVLIGQYMIWGRFVYNYWKKQRTCYGLTTRRALIVVNGFKGRTASSAYFESMTIIDKWVRHDGIGSISFGGPVSSEWKWGRNNPPRTRADSKTGSAPDFVALVILKQSPFAKSSSQFLKLSVFPTAIDVLSKRLASSVLGNLKSRYAFTRHLPAA